MRTLSTISEKLELSFPLLLGITCRSMAREASISEYLKQLFRTSADIVQWREKDLTPTQSLHYLSKAADQARKAKKIFIVNSWVKAAIQVAATGAHLTSFQDLNQAVSRRADAGLEDFLLGKSVHSLQEAVQAEKEGADYLILGPILNPLSKKASNPPLGFPVLSQATGAVSIPVFAIGGLGKDHLEEVAARGAAGLAGISWVHKELKTPDSPSN